MLISIIVPIYNAEHSLEKCITSLLSQTYKNIEIILVDDGSSDNSLNICRRFVENNHNCILVSKTNGGVSSARNAGITSSKGDAICFVDSDDYVETDMMEKLIKPFLQNELVDISMCGYFVETKKSRSVMNIYNHSTILDDNEIPNYLLEATHVPFFNPPWNKLFRSQLIKDNDTIFNEKMSLGEDFAFFLQALKKAHKFALVNEPLYHYVATEGSLTYRMRPNLWEEEKQISDYYKKYYLDIGKESMATDAYRKHLMYSIRIYLSSAFLNFADKKNRINCISKVLDDEEVKKIRFFEKESGFTSLIVSIMIKLKLKWMLYLFFNLKNSIFLMGQSE